MSDGCRSLEFRSTSSPAYSCGMQVNQIDACNCCNSCGVELMFIRVQRIEYAHSERARELEGKTVGGKLSLEEQHTFGSLIRKAGTLMIARSLLNHVKQEVEKGPAACEEDAEARQERSGQEEGLMRPTVFSMGTSKAWVDELAAAGVRALRDKGLAVHEEAARKGAWTCDLCGIGQDGSPVNFWVELHLHQNPGQCSQRVGRQDRLEGMPVLEGRASLYAVKHAFRRADAFHKRHLILSDSTVCFGQGAGAFFWQICWPLPVFWVLSLLSVHTLAIESC